MTKTLKQFIEEAEKKGGTYVAIKYTDATNKKLMELFDQIDLPDNAERLSIDELHTTLIYSQDDNYQQVTPKTLSNTSIDLSNASLEIFGADERVLVLAFNSKKLIKRNKYLVEKYGFISNFDEYKPHISIAYNIPKDFSITNIDFPLRSLDVKEEYCEPIDTDAR